MPVKRRIPKARDDYPPPWERRPVSRERWDRHRDRMMADEHAGRRPPEWWAYESPELRSPDRDLPEWLQLYEMGELSDEEIAELMPWWRQHYDRAQKPDFSYCRGPNDWLKGGQARTALYKWAGIPRDIIKQWNAERARSKTCAS